MANFGPIIWVNPFGKMYIFDFLNFFFFDLKYQKRHFPILYCLTKKLEKWPFQDQNHGLTTLKKCQFFDFLNFLFLYPRKIFFVQEYHKNHFRGLYCLQKRGKLAIFAPKPWVNPFRKMSTFRHFDLLVFIAQKGVFSFQNIIKDIFLAYIA